MAESEIEIPPELKPFITAPVAAPDVTVHISWDWHEAENHHAALLGADHLLTYYRTDSHYICELTGGSRSCIAQTIYTHDFSHMKCVVNTDDWNVPQKSLRQFLRMLPIRQILLHHRVLFLHSSQILYRNHGILFTAPSGTGKTTQANLWAHHRSAELLCNDRTLLRKHNDTWISYSYPNDGSQPVIGSFSASPCCIVVLEQGKENLVRRLKLPQATASLLSQTVFDTWDPISRIQATELILTLYRDLPVYLFSCTADLSAVQTLESTLIKEECLNEQSI